MTEECLYDRIKALISPEKCYQCWFNDFYDYCVLFRTPLKLHDEHTKRCDACIETFPTDDIMNETITITITDIEKLTGVTIHNGDCHLCGYGVISHQNIGPFCGLFMARVYYNESLSSGLSPCERCLKAFPKEEEK